MTIFVISQVKSHSHKSKWWTHEGKMSKRFLDDVLHVCVALRVVCCTDIVDVDVDVNNNNVHVQHAAVLGLA